MKIILYTNDPMLTLAYDKQEAIELFGQDYFDEVAVDELAQELISTYEKLCVLSKFLNFEKNITIQFQNIGVIAVENGRLT